MIKKVYPYMNWPKIEAIIYSEDDNPHIVLGKTLCNGGTLFQTFQPQALRVFLSYNEEHKQIEMEKIEKEGYFVAIVSERIISEFTYLVENEDGSIDKIKDPYDFEPIIQPDEIEKIENGTHYEMYECLGAHTNIINGHQGVCFLVWAPNVMRVSVVGDFNQWDGRRHPMRRLYQSGVFELFIPGLQVGDSYQFEIKLKNSLTYLKSDPFAFEMQMPPNTASIISPLHKRFPWTDKKWISFRKKTNYYDKCMNVLEVNFALFKDENGYASYQEMATEIVDYAKKMHYTHIDCMPVMEYYDEESLGYKTCNYYAPTSRYGKPDDLKYFINLCHNENIGVLFDWVPGEFSKENHGLIGFDGTGLFEHANEKQGENYTNNTKKFNYGRNEVANFLISNALYWIEKFHVDGLRLHKVGEILYLDYGKTDGEWIPNIYGGNENLEAIDFIKTLNSIVKNRNKGVITIAEDDTKWPNVTGLVKDGGLGFDYKWNVGWTYDMLGFFAKDPLFRSNVYNEFTFSMVYAYSEKYMLCFTHQEMMKANASLYDRMYGNSDEKFSNLRAMYTYMFLHPGKKMMFLKQNPKTLKSWNVKENNYNNAMNQELNTFTVFMEDLHILYEKEPALYQKDYQTKGFQWTNSVSPEECLYSFVRSGEKMEDTLFIVCNFANKKLIKKIVGVPFYGKYKEIFNSSMKKYGGTIDKIARKKSTKVKEADGMKFSINVNLAPLSIAVFKWEQEEC